MKNEQITKRLSGDELDALLRAELESSDPAAALALLEELERREPEDAAATEAAWNTFNKHYLPMEGDTSLYEAEPHRRPKVIPLIRRFSAAAVAAMLTCVLIVQAGGTNVLGTMARWTTDKFSFGDNLIFEEPSLLPGSGSEDDALQASSSSAPGADEAALPSPTAPEEISYDSLAAALDAFGGVRQVQWIPEGYTFKEATLSELFGCEDLFAVYTNEEDRLLQIHFSRVTPDTAASTIVVKDETPVELYEREGTTYYFVTNGDYRSVNWKSDELTECRISGYLRQDELRQMVDSMYE